MLGYCNAISRASEALDTYFPGILEHRQSTFLDYASLDHIWQSWIHIASSAMSTKTTF